MASNIQIVIYDFLSFLSLSFFRKLFFLNQSTQHCCRLERIQNVQIPDFNGRLKSAIQIDTEKRIRNISLQHTTRLKFRTFDKLTSVYFSSFLLKNTKVYRQKKIKSPRMCLRLCNCLSRSALHLLEMEGSQAMPNKVETPVD